MNLIGLVDPARGRQDESLNMRGAWLHVLTDALGSVGRDHRWRADLLFGWNWADPAASVVIGALVLYSSWSLLRETVAVLMEGAPGHIDVDDVRNTISGMPGVLSAHDLHVWTITSGMVALSAHVIAENPSPDSPLLGELRKTLHDRFGIDHITIQVEPEDFEHCASC